MLLVWRMKQDIRLLEMKALVQAVMYAGVEEPDDKDTSQLNVAWTEYAEEMFPFQRGQVKRQDQSAVEYLKKEVARGPLSIRPLQYLGKARSRLHRRRSSQDVASKLRERYGVK